MLRTQILEAVDALRQRKCRPEREAIAHYVLRKYGVPFQEVFSELENIVDQEELIKVEYKGSTSYRSLEAFGECRFRGKLKFFNSKSLFCNLMYRSLVLLFRYKSIPTPNQALKSPQLL